MIGECHAHIAMDGVNYARAMARHEKRPDEAHIRACFEAYRSKGVDFVRDGGDAYGVSRRAVDIAPEYGIDYRTPIFLSEYAALVDEAKAEGADFIKIMTTGIMDFNEFGRITHSDVPAAEVREMVHIAHEQGFAVMSHTNGKRAVLDAIEAGVDSIEHGNYIDDECIAALAETRTCFVPTATVARNLIGREVFDDAVLSRIWEASRAAIAAAVEAGCIVALGSDAGAVGVAHGSGVHDEHRCFADAVADSELLREHLAEGDRFIRSTFKR